MVMLQQGNKLYFIALVLLFFVSCNKYKEYDLKEIDKIRNKSQNKSQYIIGMQEYWHIYNNMNDSVNEWISNKLGNYAYWSSVIDYKLDSILCINPPLARVCDPCQQRC